MTAGAAPLLEPANHLVSDNRVDLGPGRQPGEFNWLARLEE